MVSVVGGQRALPILVTEYTFVARGLGLVAKKHPVPSQSPVATLMVDTHHLGLVYATYQRTS